MPSRLEQSREPLPSLCPRCPAPQAASAKVSPRGSVQAMGTSHPWMAEAGGLQGSSAEPCPVSGNTGVPKHERAPQPASPAP